MLFLGFTPVFAAISNGEYDGFHLGILFLIGILAHIFVFVQNDYYDAEVDAKSKYVASRPLSTGKISKPRALLLFSGAFLLALALSFLWVYTWRAFWFLLVTFFLMTIYNKYSKKLPGMECVLSTGVFSLGLFGAFTVGAPLTPLAALISFVCFLQWFFSVGISANFKDVEYDTRQGIRTTPVILGVTAEHIPRLFIAYALGIQLLFLIILGLPFLLGLTSLTVQNLPVPLLGYGVLSSLVLLTTRGILTTPLEKRDTMLRYEGAHEGLSLLLIPFVLMPLFIDTLGVLLTTSLILLLIVWPLGILRFLYGKTLIPLE